MPIRYWQIQNPLQHLRREMDRLFSNVAGGVENGGWPSPFVGQPPVNVWESAEAVFVETEIPGVTSDQVEITVAGDQLTLRVERPEKADEATVYHRRERPSGSMSRVIKLPAEVEAEQVEAQLTNGVLTITLPKAAAAKPRKINVKSL